MPSSLPAPLLCETEAFGLSNPGSIIQSNCFYELVGSYWGVRHHASCNGSQKAMDGVSQGPAPVEH
jgi:hypothetical protein